MKSDYYIGLDCGMESVGFAVTDTEYNILKFRGKAMWGLIFLMRRRLRKLDVPTDLPEDVI